MRVKSFFICMIPAVLILQLSYALAAPPGPRSIIEEGDKVFIVDKTGVRWDVTQARSIGFEPGKFQYGLGKNAFVTLDDSLLTGDTSGVPDDMRVIGVAGKNDARAYSVLKLRRHEVSNSEFDGKPVAVGY
jgi:hypothetical protein